MKGGKKRDYPPPCLSSGVFELSARLFRSLRNVEAGGQMDGRRIAGAAAPSCGTEDRGPAAVTAAQKRLKRTAGFKDGRMILSKYMLRDSKSCLFI